MSRIPSLTPGLDASAAAGRSRETDLRDVDLDQFLQLLITELQNQDPLSPMENSELLQQISQIREIGATNLLRETLESVLTGQNLAAASSLIGKRIDALTDQGASVQGRVDRVSVEPDGPEGRPVFRVHVGEHAVEVKNIRSILGEPDPEGAA